MTSMDYLLLFWAYVHMKRQEVSIIIILVINYSWIFLENKVTAFIVKNALNDSKLLNFREISSFYDDI